METRQPVCEIVEVGEGIEARSRRMLKQKQVYSVEDDIDKLFQAIDIRPVREESLWKNRMKRPMRASTSHTSVSNSSNLKQALRGLCILQASEMAAMKRQSLKLAALASESASSLSKDKMVNKSRMLDTEHKGKQKAKVKVHALAKELTEIPSNSVKTSSAENVSSEISSDITNTAKSTTSISEESNSLSGSSRCGNRPHMSKDLRWDAIREIVAREGSLSLKHFKLHRRLGSGDIGSVYLAQLLNTDCLFALKVMDNEFLARRKKLSRAETEREILQMLDHPFLPTLYAHFSTDRLSCLVMEYCPGGDLHVVRQKQPTRVFSEQAARFYAAEVVLAIEYLHMLGVIYRDLKPENILVREDGHIMLSDFDLSLRCAVNPTILRSTSPSADPHRKTNTCTESSCIDPFCLQPTFEASCFTPKLLLTKTRNPKPENNSTITSFPQLVVEPTEARSNSFVGTHEYLAPEIIKGDGHGSAVDWWTLGVFLYELLYGKTPFKGLNNDETVSNVMTKPVRLPESQIVSFYGRDLIRGLLVKEPGNRLGFAKGAVEIKQHPFFEGLNWALIRCAVPPERPRFEKGECQGSVRVGFDMF